MGLQFALPETKERPAQIVVSAYTQSGCLEELQEAAYGHAARLKIVTIPDDVKWLITKIEGGEQVSEAHRTWG